MPRVVKIEMPPESRLIPALADATFHDSFEAGLRDASLTPIEIALRLFRETPAWVEALMAIRNRLATWVGIKSVGRLDGIDARAPGDYRPGDRLGIFQVLSIDEAEVLLGIDDRDLDVRISFLKRHRDDQWRYAICSWVRTHNRLGRLYMIPVGRLHRLIVRYGMGHMVV